MKKLSLDKSKIKVLLLEGIHENGIKCFRDAGYTNLDIVETALDEKDLIERIQDVHLVCIRSRTMLTKEVLKHAKKLIAVGCYSIGTNQVDKKAAKMLGILVFNAPFSNTRSVAELVVAQFVMLMRGIPEKSAQCHRGVWKKNASNSWEVRGKNLGLIGYGHIGTQVSVLAEAMGMHVYYYDIVKKLSIGNATPCNSMDELLQISDVVSLHVPLTEVTRNMFGTKQLAKMRKGSFLVNAARGEVVDVKSVAEALKTKHLLGAAFDVFPEEPASNSDPFHSELCSFDNVILTPHIGGSTQEAQANIGTEVTEKLITYSDTGATLGAVNFVELQIMPNLDKQRLMHIHHNVPGVMKNINNIFSSHNVNIAAQFLQTDPDIGYLIIDVDSPVNEDIMKELKAVEHTIRTRVLN